MKHVVLALLLLVAGVPTDGACSDAWQEPAFLESLIPSAAGAIRETVIARETPTRRLSTRAVATMSALASIAAMTSGRSIGRRSPSVERTDVDEFSDEGRRGSGVEVTSPSIWMASSFPFR